MADAIIRGLAVAIATTPFLIACGGGKSDNPGAINTPQCSGSACGVQGPPTSTGAAATLCPATADIVKSTFLGGAGSGEVVQLNIDAAAMTYTLKWLESPIPLRTGTVTPTRVGTQITGAVIHPPTGTLPTAEQTRCAFILGAGTGTAAGDGQPYTTPGFTNNPNPPMIFVGQGVAGGGIPGATIQFDGLSIPLIGSGIGAVPNRHFDFYPFLGFASTTTDITRLPGTYNGLLYHLAPSGNYSTVATNTVETFDASGTCTSSNTANANYSPNAGGCLTTGNPLTLNGNGYFDSQQAPQIVKQFQLPLIGATGKSGIAHMILGQINGATVPLVVRTGYIDLGTAPLHLDAKVDDESGIAMLAAAKPLASGGFDGGYVGADSNFKYTATLVQGTVGTFINPTTSAAESGFGLSYGLASPGLVGVQDANGKTGLAIASGGLYAIEIQGTENGGVTSTSANSDTSSTPYFGVGAQISK
ncbi:DUF2957 domain-containing protein [Paraburkholderia rhynchosiae]|uniref:DUF2957 domain-containing protein n=1 Tax=Paraburkholderia rhynchosiae TaxID=487049 RepID=A0A2N7W4Z3_9BURK|nr:DUF2957 domain-containing protein [Paraburkholderia rhynchosiae]PMS24459.1 hypothetical protein C0Z16_31160 [Paraburkholderia rhynchosiae]CAB3736661.1 hypothetical protein LMG27174_06300 [Paraburkholderia rhynchosiae]